MFSALTGMFKVGKSNLPPTNGEIPLCKGWGAFLVSSEKSSYILRVLCLPTKAWHLTEDRQVVSNVHLQV